MKAEMKVLRFKYTDKSTISEFYLNGTLYGYTLEDVDRGLDDSMKLDAILDIKKYGETAIPTGTYKVTLYQSPKHGLVPLLHDVKGFDMIEIHAGNFPKDSLGCLLLGSSYKEDAVKNSRNTMSKLMEELTKHDLRTELPKYNEMDIQIFKKRL